ncbi:MAG: type IX secretion system membrane protein PorP/SprF [Prolixibacteraceae bacterium]|jgi:type IX secretion system PorP/SprF family membrane protein|nr:type IX secretion system membrane protein PorP/SprF [Prolixibacteraceae bacterium]
MKQNLLKHIILVIVLLSGLKGFSQQDPMFTQYMNNPVLINPSYAGTFGNLNVNGIFRKQWVGFDWQPTTTSISVTSPFLDYTTGVGFTFLHDDIGPLSQTGFYADYAYHLDFNDAQLSLGLKAGFNYYVKDLQGLTTNDFDWWVSLSPLTSKFLFNTGVGAFYYTNDYYIGFSIPKLIRNSLAEDENTYEIVGREERHLFLTGGAIFDINPIVKIKPSTMLRMVNGAPFSIDITATAIVYERVWAGLMYRVGESLGAHFRMTLTDGLQLGYSYDYNNSRLSEYNNGTHEVFISYTIRQRSGRILSPRYF